LAVGVVVDVAEELDAPLQAVDGEIARFRQRVRAAVRLAVDGV